MWHGIYTSKWEPKFKRLQVYNQRLMSSPLLCISRETLLIENCADTSWDSSNSSFSFTDSAASSRPSLNDSSIVTSPVSDNPMLLEDSARELLLADWEVDEAMTWEEDRDCKQPLILWICERYLKVVKWYVRTSYIHTFARCSFLCVFFSHFIPKLSWYNRLWQASYQRIFSFDHHLL